MGLLKIIIRVLIFVILLVIGHYVSVGLAITLTAIVVIWIIFTEFWDQLKTTKK